MVKFGDYGKHEALVFERTRLPPQFVASGPLIVEEATSTTMVLPDQQLRVDDYGFLRITELHS
jgi:N-methylhydantoinase A